MVKPAGFVAFKRHPPRSDTQLMRRLVAIVLVTGVLGTACASAPASSPAHRSPSPTSPTGDVITVLEAASERTIAAGSAHMDLWMYVTAAGRTIQITGRGDILFGNDDPQKAAVHMTMELPGAGLAGSTGSIEMIVAPGLVFYLKADAFGPVPHLRTPWIKFDPATLGPRYAKAFEALTSAANDPSGSMSFTYGLTEAHRVGLEIVDGTTTTHYRATVDLAKALRENPVARRPAVRRLLRGYRRMVADQATFPMDIWIDTDGYLKQMDYRLPVAPPDAVGGGDVGMTMTLSGVGRPVHIDAPPANQVTDIADLLPGSVSNL
jgi:hypothetical protein